MSKKLLQAYEGLFDEVEAYFHSYIPTAESDEWDMYQAYQRCLEAADEGESDGEEASN